MTKNNTIQLGHGGGGLLSKELIAAEIISRFGEGPLKGLPDGARLPAIQGEIVFSTDSFVVSPTFFPGGNVGDLAVHGTVNDLSVCGSVPKWLSLGMIIEEGFAISSLQKILDSVKAAAVNCGVTIATGDTKVVARGQCDGIYLNTAGIGEAIPGFQLDCARLSEGDSVIASGTLGDHGMAVMAAREGLKPGASLVSDSGPVHRLVQSIAHLAPQIRFMRDPTRGGAAATLNEIVEGRPLGIVLEQSKLPFLPSARGLAEVLGLDLLHVASEGRVLLVCDAAVADEVVSVWRDFPEGKGAAIIGRVSRDTGRVLLETGFGGRRLVDVPQGELLPRIC